MKYYIIAGEASGDLHGSNLIKELKKLDASAVIRCWGGDKMQQAGGDLVKHYRDLAFMGFWEVIKNIFTILRNLKFCKKDIEQFQPDSLILIDYPGFNLRIAEWAKQKGYRVIYYISPQVWAWKENRVRKMKQNISKMIVILPFEKDYFKNKWNWDVEYVGHPLVEVVQSAVNSRQLAVNSGQLAVNSGQTAVNSGQTAVDSQQPNAGNSLFTGFAPLAMTSHNSPIIALLPGSRKQEILKKLPVMLEVSKAFPNNQFIVAKAPGLDDNFYSSLLSSYNNVSSVSGKTYDLLMQSKAALVTSGTATLETALFGVPEVVCYKGSFLSYEIGKRLVKVKYISLVNLIMDKLVVKELIQHDMNVKNLQRELEELLNNEKRIAVMKKDFADLKNVLSQHGNASAKAAQIVYNYTSEK
ncbi:MAG TPA: lipid-A-disaccharide synthase [Chitinophagaceae bacterium]|nr:lipid-A-disaccharide synthase [Chitinophagaceae bacterium]